MASGAACPKIFVVDDDEAVRDSIKILLEIHGLDVEDFGSIGDFAANASAISSLASPTPGKNWFWRETKPVDFTSTP